MSFKLCVIGCGEHSANFHGPSYRKYARLNGDVVLAACCDLNGERARRFQNSFGFASHYTDMDRMLETERPDAVGLVSPVELTASLAARVLEMGIPLILEKPPGRTKEETKRLKVIAERHHVPNRVAFNRRYSPLVRELRMRLNGSDMPPIQNIICEMFRVSRRDEDFSTTAIHVVDSVRFLAASDYTKVRFSYDEMSTAGDSVANIHMECAFESGAKAFLNICPLTGVSVERTTVNLIDNTFFLHAPMYSDFDAPGSLVHLQNNRVVFSATGNEISDGAEPFEALGVYYENASFFDDLRAGRTPDGDIASALQSVEVGECIRNRTAEYRAH